MSDGERQPLRKGHLELVRGQQDARPFVHLLMNFLHRADQDRRKVHAGDLDLAVVSETVGLAVIAPDMRKPQFRETYGDFQTVIGVDGQRGVNATTISGATGIPRETVRRKLKLLVERGVIVEKSRGTYVFKPGYIQQPAMRELIERGMRDTLQFMNDCMKLGLIQWVEDEVKEG